MKPLTQPLLKAQTVKNFNDYAKFVGSVALAIIAISMIQQKVIKVPVVGEYLPGF